MDRRRYVEHFAVLFMGTVASQALNLASYPFLARIYSPADFGLFATFVAAAAIPSAIACARFDLVIPTLADRSEHAGFWISVAMSALAGVLSGAGAAAYGLAVGGGMDGLRALLLGLCVFFTGFCMAASPYLLRHDWYRLNSVSVLVRTGSTVGLQIALGFFWPTDLSLILGFTLGAAAQALLFAFAMSRRASPGRPHAGEMRDVFRAYRRQVAVDVPSTMIAALSLNLMTFLLASAYGKHAVGLYALGSRIAVMPLQLFNDAISQVYFQKAARAQRERGRFWNELKFSLIASGALSIAVILAIWVFAEPFVILFLGPDWAPAAQMIVILAPMLAMRSICLSVLTTAFVLRKAHWLFIHNVANVGVLCAAFLAANVLQLGVMEFLALASALLFIEYALFTLVLVVAARNSGPEEARA